MQSLFYTKSDNFIFKSVNRDFIREGETVVMYPACVLTFVSSHISKLNFELDIVLLFINNWGIRSILYSSLRKGS